MHAARYLDVITKLIAKFQENELEATHAAALLAAEAVLAGGRLHHFDTGHMKKEPIRRAGGLLGLHPLELLIEAFHVLPSGRKAELSTMEQQYFYDREDFAPFLLDKSHVKEGDVLIQVSNSGKEPFTVGVGVEAKKRGLKLIALTSLEFSKGVKSKHSSGKRLFEIADAVVDLCAPFGDAVLDMPGVDTKVGATSGVMTAVALWALMTEITGILADRGQPPAIYRSVNMPDGFEFNRTQRALYEKRGF
jgi:uncharacterized phosphosugar-binding protein